MTIGRMSLQLLTTTVVTFFAQMCLTEGLSVSQMSCSGSTLHDFQIAGCDEQPCTIRKGVPLPFEIDMSFTQPEVSNNVYFNVFIPKYAVPPSAHGSSVITTTCDKGNLGFDCPVSSDKQYKLKSFLMVDPKAVCTGNCENMGANGTGIRETKWRWAVTERRRKGEPAGQNLSSSCTFRVSLNITE